MIFSPLRGSHPGRGFELMAEVGLVADPERLADLAGGSLRELQKHPLRVLDPELFPPGEETHPETPGAEVAELVRGQPELLEDPVHGTVIDPVLAVGHPSLQPFPDPGHYLSPDGVGLRLFPLDPAVTPDPDSQGGDWKFSLV